jgi:hypothetical protein
LDVAVAVRATQRHVSFIESGRAALSRDMVLRLSAAMVIPLRAAVDFGLCVTMNIGSLRGVQPDPSETGDCPDGRGAKMTGAAQPNHDLRGQKRMGDSQNFDLKGHGAAARHAVGSAA